MNANVAGRVKRGALGPRGKAVAIIRGGSLPGLPVSSPTLRFGEFGGLFNTDTKRWHLILEPFQLSNVLRFR